jgi:hypothetical protein
MNWYLIISSAWFLVVLWAFIIVDIRKQRKGLTIYHADEYWLRVLFVSPAAWLLFKSCYMSGWWPVMYHSLIVAVLLASWWWLLFDGLTNLLKKHSLLYNGSGGAKNNSEADKILRGIGEIPALLLKVVLITASTILFYYMQKGKL